MYIKEYRVRAGYPMYLENAEYLYDEMMKSRPADFQFRSIRYKSLRAQ